MYVDFDENEIRMKNQSEFVKIAWSRVARWTENDRFLLLYRTTMECRYFPKDEIDTQLLEEIKDNLAKANVPVF